jgi:UDP-N-acetylmuramoyl-L-alanyl-D-glutamate--2,6-diaminopimelate ligase
MSERSRCLLSELLAALPRSVELPGQDVTVTGISDDSRQVRAGTLFVAVPGVAVDGQRFIPQAVLVGVTGTDGKTTTTNLLYAMLEVAGCDVGMISTVNARIGERTCDTGLHTTTPPSGEVQRYLAEMVAAGMTHAVLEVTSHGLAQRRLAGCDFDVSLIASRTCPKWRCLMLTTPAPTLICGASWCSGRCSTDWTVTWRM